MMKTLKGGRTMIGSEREGSTCFVLWREGDREMHALLLSFAVLIGKRSSSVPFRSSLELVANPPIQRN